MTVDRNDPDVQTLYDKLSSMENAIVGGFRAIHQDVRYLKALYVPLVVVTVIALILAILAFALALDNRATLLSRLSQIDRGVQNIQQDQIPRNQFR